MEHKLPISKADQKIYKNYTETLRTKIEQNALSVSRMLDLYNTSSTDESLLRDLKREHELCIYRSMQLYILDCQINDQKYLLNSGFRLIGEHAKACQKKFANCYVCEQLCRFAMYHYKRCFKANCSVQFCKFRRQSERSEKKNFPG